jgi:hypothetical protein
MNKLDQEILDAISKSNCVGCIIKGDDLHYKEGESSVDSIDALDANIEPYDPSDVPLIVVVNDCLAQITVSNGDGEAEAAEDGVIARVEVIRNGGRVKDVKVLEVTIPPDGP